MQQRGLIRNVTQKKAMLEALTKTLGIVTQASKLTGIERVQHYRWMETDPKYKKAVESLADMVLDFAESKLHEQIMNNDTAATIFYLKTKGKKRGYIEKVETGFTNAEGKDILPQIVLQPAPGCEEIKEE